MGHARALLGLGEPAQMGELAQKIVAQGLSVRETEQLVKRKKSRAREPSAETDRSSPHNPHARQMEEDLQRALGTRVRLIDRGGKGILEIHFFSYGDLDRLVSQLRK